MEKAGDSLTGIGGHLTQARKSWVVDLRAAGQFVGSSSNLPGPGFVLEEPPPSSRSWKIARVAAKIGAWSSLNQEAAVPAEPDFLELWRLLAIQFRLGQGSIHGPTHWQNVERNGLELARETGADVTVVRLFAVFHDSRRQNESSDPEHGARAEVLLRSMQGGLFELEPARLELLAEACRLHNHGHCSSDPTIGTCWDADRLDLPRVGMRPMREFMSTEAGKRRVMP